MVWSLVTVFLGAVQIVGGVERGDVDFWGVWKRGVRAFSGVKSLRTIYSLFL